MSLSIEGIVAGYGKAVVLGREGPVSLAFEPGQFTAVVGPNGCGKSTMLRTAAGLHRPRAGRALLGGRDVRTLGRRAVGRALAFVPQSPESPPGATVRELVSLGRHPHLSWHGRWRAADGAAVASSLDRCGLGDLADRVVTSLSGGERQRAWVAMALAQAPGVLLLDEPTAALDVRHQLEVLGLVSALCAREGLTAVAVLHDLNLAARYADRIVAMRDGSVRADGPASAVLTERTVAEVFGVRAEVRTDGEGRVVCVPLEPVG